MIVRWVDFRTYLVKSIAKIVDTMSIKTLKDSPVVTLVVKIHTKTNTQRPLARMTPLPQMETMGGIIGPKRYTKILREIKDRL